MNENLSKEQLSNIAKIEDGLGNHRNGTNNYYRHNLGFVYTNGVSYVAESCKAYWLLDVIASVQFVKKVAKEPFQVHILKTDLENETAVFTVEDGNDNEVYRQEIKYTDFPLPEISIWFQNNTMLLPSEY